MTTSCNQQQLTEGTADNHRPLSQRKRNDQPQDEKAKEGDNEKRVVGLSPEKKKLNEQFLSFGTSISDIVTYLHSPDSDSAIKIESLIIHSPADR